MSKLTTKELIRKKEEEKTTKRAMQAQQRKERKITKPNTQQKELSRYK
jgi:hypothetical protein